MAWLWPERAQESTPEQVAATGAAAGSWGGAIDPVDGDRGYVSAGQTGRELPAWSQEKARTYSVASYRSNPMAKAIIDTYVAFCVGDTGVSFQCSNKDVYQVVEAFWDDPRVNLAQLQEPFLRDQLIMGETLIELIEDKPGVVQISPMDTTWITSVSLVNGNPLWPNKVWVRRGAADPQSFQCVQVNDDGLREGDVMFWTPFKALMTDRRSPPFLMTVLDWLDSYDMVLSNLIDRTALARYMVWDVTIEGTSRDVDNYVEARGGHWVPPSGSVEFHNESVTWDVKTTPTGAQEDTIAGQSVLTNIAGGAGLAKTWLAEPDGANRATSLSMAEPVRRRVQSVQKSWLTYQTELNRFVVDRAVAAGVLDKEVEAIDPKTGEKYKIPASRSVTVTGPEIAAADSQITAQVLLNLSTALQGMVTAGIMSPEAAKLAAKKGWEDYVGVPYSSELDAEANPDDIAQHIEDQQPKPPAGGVNPKAAVQPVPQSPVPAKLGEAASRASGAEDSTQGKHLDREAFDAKAHPRDNDGKFANKPGGPHKVHLVNLATGKVDKHPINLQNKAQTGDSKPPVQKTQLKLTNLADKPAPAPVQKTQLSLKNMAPKPSPDGPDSKPKPKADDAIPAYLGGVEYDAKTGTFTAKYNGKTLGIFFDKGEAEAAVRRKHDATPPEKRKKAPKAPVAGKPLRGTNAYNSIPGAADIGLSESERNALHNYTNTAYSDMNKTLRKGSWGGNPDATKYHREAMRNNVKELDKAFQKAEPLQQPIIVSRGMSSQVFGAVGSKNGKTFSDRGYTSTTAMSPSSKAMSNFFGNDDAQLEIEIPAGARVLRPDGAGAYGDDEKEILLPRNSKFEIVSDKMVNGKRKIKLRLVME